MMSYEEELEYKKFVGNKAKKLLDVALSSVSGKCQGAEVLFDFSKTLSMSSEKENLSKYSVSSTSIMGIRLIKEGRLGISYSEALDEKSIEEMAFNALSNSRFSEVKDYEKITIKDREIIENLDYTLPKEESPSLDRLKEDAVSLESKVMKKDPNVVATPYTGLYKVQGGRLIKNHLGSYFESDFRYYGAYTSALIQKDNISSTFHHGVVGKCYKDLKLDDCVDISYNEARQLLDAKPLQTKKYDTIFSIESLHQIFSCFSLMFSGLGALEGHNPFRSKLNEKTFSDALTITDNPLYTNGLSYSTFDAEGEIRKPLVLVDKGSFKSFFHNSKTASHFNCESTGHASRSAKSSLGVSSTHLFIEKGEINKTTLHKDEIFLVTNLQGLHSGAKAVSGEFSFGAKGYLLKDGQVVSAVKGVTVSGNFYQMLNDIVGIGTDIESHDLTFFSPQIRFSKLSIAGS